MRVGARDDGGGDAGKAGEHHAEAHADLIARYSAPVPRYTSYPTAAEFSDKWSRLPPRERRLTGIRAAELADPASEAMAIPAEFASAAPITKFITATSSPVAPNAPQYAIACSTPSLDWGAEVLAFFEGCRPLIWHDDEGVWVDVRGRLSGPFATEAEAERVLGKSIDREYNLADLLRRPDVTYQGLMSMDASKHQNAEILAGLSGDDVSRETTRAIIEQIEIAAKYSGYIDRQKVEVERSAYYENLKLPSKLDYLQVSSLSIEARQKLDKHRPETLGMASRISGITPATISLLLVYLKRRGRSKSIESGSETTTGKAA
mgnify:CR=1 FL=1